MGYDYNVTGQASHNDSLRTEPVVVDNSQQNSTSDDQVFAQPGFSQSYSVSMGYDYNATGQALHNASFNYSHPLFFENPSPNNPRSSGNVSESHTSSRLLVCKWNDGHGLCGKTLNKKDVAKHMSSSHLRRVPGAIIVECQWQGCTEPMRRDTILRHIRQLHFEINPRRQS
ncbi:uncharacterized protein EDB93DRAFT_1184182 [Suillus bovinus]|uniref:uncharacterized protein n=1 Tax=Suillus bovinus TaxID=48563 RepID=UPI001B877C20|nr:uncharacterized protein EDB93DRAFT_1184182 [Suillus bovinus]KAG2128659.1 hypothetical protein EDB93DRAFT_1184182 [Suillus bovinus]